MGKKAAIESDGDDLEDEKTDSDERKGEKILPQLDLMGENLPFTKVAGKFKPYATSKLLLDFPSLSNRHRVRKILEALEGSPDFKWSETSGDVIMNGKKVIGSNIKRLLKTAVGHSGLSQNTKEWIKFKKVLDDFGLRHKLRTRKQTGQGISRLPKSVSTKWHSLTE